MRTLVCLIVVASGAAASQAQTWVYESAPVVREAYRLEYETVYDEREVTAYRLVQETVYEEKEVTTYRPVWETETRERRYTVAKPVDETTYQTRRYTVRRPVYETSDREVTETQWREVTTYRPVTVDQGGYVDQAYCVPGPVRNRLTWAQGAYATDPYTGVTTYYRGGLQWMPEQLPSTYAVQRVWQQNLVTQQVPQTSLVPETIVKKVPVQTVRYEDVVQEEQVPVTTRRIEYVEQVEQVPVRVCKQVAETQSVSVPRVVTKRVPYTYTVREPRTVVRKVPVTLEPTCCGGYEAVESRVLPPRSAPAGTFRGPAPEGAKAGTGKPAIPANKNIPEPAPAEEGAGVEAKKPVAPEKTTAEKTAPEKTAPAKTE